MESVGGTYNGEVVNAGNWVDGCIQNKPLGDVYYFNRKDSNKDTGIFGGHRVCIGLLYLRKYATNVGIFFCFDAQLTESVTIRNIPILLRELQRY